MTDRTAAKKRAQLLKKLRAKHEETVERTKVLLREQKGVQREITTLLGEGSKTVPDLAGEMDLPSEEVLWHLTAMRKYDLVEEDGMSGMYVLYKLVEESK